LGQNEGINFRFPDHKPIGWAGSFWGVESERQMYYTKKTSTGPLRFIGLGSVIAINALVGLALAFGLGNQIVSKLTETEVVIIQEEEKPDEEPPPPPPVDVELPPPPPQVVLPEFTFDAPPPPNAISQVTLTPTPKPAQVRPAPPPPPPRPSTPPKIDSRRFGEMLVDDYPAASLRAKEEGVVTVTMCVDVSGKISDVKVVKSSGFSRLDEATVKGLSRMRMSQPAKNGEGKPVPWCAPPYPLDVQWRIPGR
jgi:periplasmic protein TonB